jgi:hypothetical protein
MPRNRRMYRRPPAAAPDPLGALQKGTYGIGGEVLGSYSLYDTMVLASGVVTNRMFTTPLGGAAGRTLDMTNMTQGGQIAQGQNLTVKRLKLFYASSALKGTAAIQALYSALAHTTCEIVIPGKDVLGQWTMQELFGVSLAFAMEPTTAGNNLPLIMPVFKGIFSLEIPLVLAALTPFELRVIAQTPFDSSLNGDFLKIALNGTLRRSA